MALDPSATTVRDLCVEALKEAGAFGRGQTPLNADVSEAQTRLQWMLQEWERKRYHVFHEQTLVVTSNGQQTYTVGPGGQFDTGVGSVRPQRVESAFLRVLQGSINPVDYPLDLIQSMEDYSRVSLKDLVSWTGGVFYDSGWPLGLLYPVPIPQANLYALGIVAIAQLPQNFAASTEVFNLPYEYLYAMVTNLAMRLRPKYGIGTYAGDQLPGLAKEALATLKGANTQIPRLQMPKEILRRGIYNIFSDRSY